MQVNRSLEEGIPEKGGRVHDINGDYRIVELHTEREICTLHDTDMAEAVLLDLQEDRISEAEARRIADSGLSSFLYNLRLNLRSFLDVFLGVVD